MHASILHVLFLFLLYISTGSQVEAQSQGNGNVTLTFTSSTSLSLATFPTVVTATLPSCAVCLCDSGRITVLTNFCQLPCSEINSVVCSYSDLKCNCGDANIVNVVVACIKQSCSEFDVVYAQAYWLQVCGGLTSKSTLQESNHVLTV